MNWLISSVLVFLFTIVFPISCLAEDGVGSSYKAGQIFGYFFVAVLVFLIIKKIMGKS